LSERDAALERGDRVVEVPHRERHATERGQRLHDREWVVGRLRDPDRLRGVPPRLDESTKIRERHGKPGV
jgi:hypothetical protein